MTQLNDALADIPLEDRIKLFESHIKPFGAGMQKVIFGKRYDEKYNNYPVCTKYNPDKSLEYLRAKQYSAAINKSLHLWRKEENNPSVRPEPNHDWIKPFGGDCRPGIGPQETPKIFKI